MGYLVTTAAMHTHYQGWHLLCVRVWCLLMLIGVRNVHKERAMRVSPETFTFLSKEDLVYLHISWSSK